jgi:hypothetical protein
MPSYVLASRECSFRTIFYQLFVTFLAKLMDPCNPSYVYSSVARSVEFVQHSFFKTTPLYYYIGQYACHAFDFFFATEPVLPKRTLKEAGSI